ncbi:MAG TPA: condensation domain-containing protein, partial [Bryobacteraceae bacterium]|nr:condensation domain-containing protein [Bryobacteraceae bacterium]
MASPDYLSPLKKRLLERLLQAEAKHQVREAPIEPRSPKERVPLAPCQHQIWLHAQLDPQAPLYNGTMTLHFNGPLDRAALERAMDEMIQRHEIWRTTFAYVDGQVVQAIHDRLPIEIPFHDLTSFPKAARQQEAIRLATPDARRPFDLGIGPLIRARLVKLDQDQYQLFLVQHHLIHDGVTIYGVLMSELPAIYDAFSKNQPSPLPQPKLQYADFALWQKRSLENDTGEQLAYWQKQLAGEVPPLNLPADRPRPAVFSFRGAAADFAVPAGLAAAVRETAHREGVTPFALMLAVLKTLLFRYTGNEDLVVGTFTDVRRRAEFELTAGFLMNTLVLRSRPSAGRTFRDYLREVKDTVLDGLSHRDIPLDQVVREIQWQRDPIRHPVFQTSFTLVPPLPIPDARWKRTESEVSAGAAKWDL